jgi:hypothetical protein
MAAVVTILGSLLGVGLAQNAEKPRVFISGKGSVDVNSDSASSGNRWFRARSSRSTIDSHDESMEMAKDFSKECPGVTVTVNQAIADYTVSLNRESKKNRGLLRSNNQVMIVNRLGDMLHAGATHAVSSATKDACSTILADWKENGRLQVPAVSGASAPAAAAASAPVAQAPAAQPVVVQPAVQPSTTSQPQQESVGDVARHAREQKAKDGSPQQ